MREFETVVVGAGVMGSAAAYHLAKAGRSTLLLDQFSLPHSRGSSHGQTRGIRKAYNKGFYSEMIVDAFEGWKLLEEETKERLLQESGLLSIGKYGNAYLASTEENMKNQKYPFERLTSEQMKERYPQLVLPPETYGVYDPQAGVLSADKCLLALRRQFKQRGGTIHDAEPVIRIQGGAPAQVVTSKATYTCRSVIITGGPWTNQLLRPLGLELPLKVERVQVCYWRQRVKGHELGSMPLLYMEDLIPGNNACYAIPACEYPNHIKACLHTECSEVDPDHRDQDPRDTSHLLSGLIKKHIPGLDPELSIQESCLYTMTPDEDFIIDSHPHHSNVIIAAGFSGHGFKLAPVVGKMLADMAQNSKTAFSLEPFRIARFNKAKL